GGRQFDTGVLVLSSDDLPITVQAGDTVTAYLTLDAPLTVPASVSITSLALDLFGQDFPGGDVVTQNNVMSFSLAGSTVLSGGGAGFSTGTSGALIEGVDLFPPNNGAFSFDQAQFSFTVDTLSGPATLTGGQFAYENFDGPAAAPEPAAWALMLLGFGGLGAMLRSRRRAAVA
ncbi:MAG: PEPxxWA-CTERM sorting domain-containing protein, partial [Proteobacteria bacterium]|nr:PEPxxWA-CTERM sorting domain-containing protein [Pseudomonadota bacterium]